MPEQPGSGAFGPRAEALEADDVFPGAEPYTSPELDSDALNDLAVEYGGSPSPAMVPAQPVAVPAGRHRRKLPSGEYHYLTRWTFVLMLAAVWLPAAVGGAALYYWWFHSLDKTWPLFVALLVVVVCAVSGLLLVMVEDKPLVTGLGLALMSVLFAATAGAALLHGAYFFQWIDRPG